MPTGYAVTKKVLPHYGVPNFFSYSSLRCEITSWPWQRFWKTSMEWMKVPSTSMSTPKSEHVSVSNFLGMHGSNVFSCFPHLRIFRCHTQVTLFYLGPLIDPKSDHSVSKVVQPFFSKGFKVLCKVYIFKSFQEQSSTNLKLSPISSVTLMCFMSLTQEFFMNISRMSWPWDTRSS